VAFWALRHPVLALTRRREGLTDQRADSRVSAFVYGDVLVLAATLGVSPAAIRSGDAILVIAGTVVSTYLAHVLADVIGAVFDDLPLGRATRAELRDSVPIISAGLPSGVLFGAASLGWPSPIWAQVLAAGLLVTRIAAIGLVYRRLRRPIPLPQALGVGGCAAVLAAATAGLKLLLVH
jgi:hypothetical protein